MNLPAHGSNPSYLFKALNREMPEKVIDFSANINPLGPPSIVQENWQKLLTTITNYPDPNGLRLKEKLAEELMVTPNEIMLGNGGAELISLIGRMLAGSHCVIIQPAFSEYEEACRVNGCEIEYHQLTPGSWELHLDGLSSKLEKADAVFLCNPNNPTGLYYRREIVLDLLELCQQNDCLLIVDEAFYDFMFPYVQLVRFLKQYKNLLLIRSMTKMYAIPGVRLGYLLGDPSYIQRLQALQPHWSVSSIALQVGEWCLEEKDHRINTLVLIEQERDKLFAFYKENEFQFSASRANFYLLRDPLIPDQLEFFYFLLEKGVVPRHTMNFPGVDGEYLRFAVKTPEENDLLMEVLTEWRKQHPSCS